MAGRATGVAHLGPDVAGQTLRGICGEPGPVGYAISGRARDFWVQEAGPKLFVDQDLGVKKAEGGSGDGGAFGGTPRETGIELIDWSPEGHRLLVLEGFWALGLGCWRNQRARIYDADAGGKLSREGEFSEAFRRWYAGQELLWRIAFAIGIFRQLGRWWLQPGRMRMRRASCRRIRCVNERRGIWIVDPAGFGIRRVRHEFR